jgi:acyl dehydratase
MPFGRYSEEFEIGDVFEHWPGRTITEADNTWFSLLTMNQHLRHIDAHHASQAQDKGCLFPGCRHTCFHPMFHGDTLYAESRILDKRVSARPDRGIAHLETAGRNQHGEIVIRFKRRVLIPKRAEEAR